MSNLVLLERLGAVEPIDDDLLERTAELLASLDVTAPVGDDQSTGDPGARLARSSHRGRGVATLSAAAAAVVALVVAGVVPSPSSGPPAAGASELAKLALAAETQPAPTAPGPGQYQYTQSVEAYTSSVLDGPHPYTYLLPETRSIWIGSDGSGRILETYGQAGFLSPQDQAAWVAAGSPNLQQAPSDSTFGPGGLSDGPTDLSKLPTDPSALATMISSRHIEGGPPGPAEDFTQVGDLLRETDASPTLRAALFTVAESIPGVEQLGTVRDHSGRQGVGVAFVSGGSRHELIFNPADSGLMGEEDVVVDAAQAHEPVGTLTDWVVYLASGVVNSDTAVPAPPAAPKPSD